MVVVNARIGVKTADWSGLVWPGRCVSKVYRSLGDTRELGLLGAGRVFGSHKRIIGTCPCIIDA